MATSWIKMRTDLPTCPKVAVIANLTKLRPTDVIGRLLVFWAWADSHTADGAAPVTPEWIDGLVGKPGFAEALQHPSVHWLEVGPGSVTLPDYERHNGPTAKKRAQAAQRQATRRVRKAQQPRDAVRDGQRDGARDEVRTRGDKRREEESHPSSPDPARAPAQSGGGAGPAGGMDGRDERRGTLAGLGVGGVIADRILASPVTDDEIRAEVAAVQQDPNVRHAPAVVVARLATRHGIEIPRGKRLDAEARAFGDRIEQLRRART